MARTARTWNFLFPPEEIVSFLGCGPMPPPELVANTRAASPTSTSDEYQYSAPVLVNASGRAGFLRPRSWMVNSSCDVGMRQSENPPNVRASQYEAPFSQVISPPSVRCHIRSVTVSMTTSCWMTYPGVPIAMSLSSPGTVVKSPLCPVSGIRFIVLVCGRCAVAAKGARHANAMRTQSLIIVLISFTCVYS